MKNMGISFVIPNKHGNYLSDILEPLPFADYQWLIDDDEIHLLHDNKFTNEFLFNEDRILPGEKLYSTSKDNTHYMVFVTLRAFSPNSTIKPVSNYKEFLESDCQIVLVVSDCSYVMFWYKDNQLVSHMYNYAISKGYAEVKYISEEDLIEGKCYIS